MVTLLMTGTKLETEVPNPIVIVAVMRGTIGEVGSFGTANFMLTVLFVVR